MIGAASVRSAPGPLSDGVRLCFSARSAQHVVLLEPGLHLAPCILGGFLAVAGAVIGVEAVRSARIDLELGGLLGFRESGLQRLHRRPGKSGVPLPQPAPPPTLYLRGQLGWGLPTNP